MEQVTFTRIKQNKDCTDFFKVFYISLGSLKKNVIIELGLEEILRGHSENTCLRIEKLANTN